MNDAGTMCLMRFGGLALLSLLAGCEANTPSTTASEMQSAVVDESPAPRGAWRLDEAKDVMTDQVTVYANAFSDTGTFWVACEQREAGGAVVYSAGVADGSRLGRWTHHFRRETLVRFDREEPVYDLNWWYGDDAAYLDDQNQILPFIQKVRAAQNVTFRLMRNDFSRADVAIQAADPDNIIAAWEARCTQLLRAASYPTESQEASEQ